MASKNVLTLHSFWSYFRPVQKLFPIEVRNENERAEIHSDEFGGPALDASLIAPSRPPRRAAALDSQWKTQGMLDS